MRDKSDTLFPTRSYMGLRQDLKELLACCRAPANRPTLTFDRSADAACRDTLDTGRRERLRKAGVLSGDFRPTT